MATRTKPNWKVLDSLLPVLEQEGWSHAQMADDWGISLATLENHLIQEVSMSAISKHDYPALFEEHDQRLASGESPKEIRATFESRGVNWGTYQNRRSQWHKAHRSTPQEHHDIPQTHPSTPEDPELSAVHSSTPEPTEILSDEQYTQEHLDTLPDPDHTEGHQGTLEGHQEVMDEVHQSVPDAPHIGTEEVYQSTLEHLSTPTPIELSPEEKYTQEHHSTLDDSDIPEVHHGTPKVHRDVSLEDSGVLSVHSGVPARQEWPISTPMGHPGTPTAEDWELWTIIKARWEEIEKMLADRQAVLSTPSGTPGHTQKKTYVFDVQHIALIDRYAQEHRLDLKDVIYTMCQEFFQQRGYVARE
jgi:hypothetical protein